MAGTVDAQVFVGESIQGFVQTAEELLTQMDRLEVERSILAPVRPLSYAYNTENEAVAEMVRQRPDRFWAVGRVDARRPDAVQETERCLIDLGLRGIFLHPWEDAISVASPRLDGIVEVCAARQAPVIVAAGYPWVSEAPQIADLATRHPRVPIIMTNGGQINISGLGQQNARLALRDCSNIYMTTSGTYRQDFIEEVIIEFGADRVLFGSSSPSFDADFELHRILWARIDTQQRETVLHSNALRLFGEVHRGA